MKKLVLLSMLSFAVLSVGCNGNAASKVDEKKLEEAKVRDKKMAELPIIEFDKVEYDFGTAKEGEKVKGTFKVTNKGKSKLVIFSAKASCGCTVPDWPKEPIAPGATAEIKFTFNTKGRSGKQTKTITLKTNTKKGAERLKIKGTISKK